LYNSRLNAVDNEHTPRTSTFIPPTTLSCMGFSPYASGLTLGATQASLTSVRRTLHIASLVFTPPNEYGGVFLPVFVLLRDDERSDRQKPGGGLDGRKKGELTAIDKETNADKGGKEVT
jgi:hypothetical protein